MAGFALSTSGPTIEQRPDQLAEMNACAPVSLIASGDESFRPGAAAAIFV